MEPDAFEKWLAEQGSFDSPEETAVVAKAAWEAAKASAQVIARDAAKRYSCSKMRGICNAIADRIERDV